MTATRYCSRTALLLLVAAASLLLRMGAAQPPVPCTCPNINGSCVSCPTAAQCCGANTENPSCLQPGYECCSISSGATQCLDSDVCCGDVFDGAFCCSSGSSCCANEYGFGTICCGPTEVCCGASERDSTCCDAETETCGEWGTCTPKQPITPSPSGVRGGLEWAANLTAWYAVYGPVAVNATHVAASAGSGVSLVRLADGARTLLLSQPAETPLLMAGGRLIVSNFGQLLGVDVATGQVAWNVSAWVDSQFPMVALGDYLVVSSFMAVTVYNARYGTELYNYTVSQETNGGPVVTKHGTVAISASRFLLFQLASGVLLVNVSNPCQFGATTAVDDALGVVLSCSLVAYDAKTGEVRWSYGEPVVAESLAVSSDAYVAGGYMWIAGVSKSNGTLLWNISVSTDSYQVLHGAGKRVLAVGNSLVAYAAATGHVDWTCDALIFRSGVPSYGFAFTKDGHFAYTLAHNASYPLAVIALNTTDGAVADYYEVGMWQQGFYVNSPLLVGGHALFLSENGFLYTFSSL